MKITQYLNQTAIFEERLPEQDDDWGKQAYADPITIRCRFEKRVKIHKTKTGHERLAVTEYMTEHPIKEGDRIDDQELQAVAHIQDFKKTIGYKGYPKAPTTFTS